MIVLLSTLPLIAFVAAVVATNPSWRLGAALFLGAPFLAASMIILVGMLPASDIGPVGSLRDWISYVLTALVFILPDAVYPRSAWIGLFSLLGWELCKRSIDLDDAARGRRMLWGAGSGLLAGAAIAAAVFLVYQTPLADLGSTSGFSNRFRPPPSFLPMALLTGSIDGLTAVWFDSPSIQPRERRLRGTAADRSPTP